MKLVIIAFLMIFIFGCATGDPFQARKLENKENALVYIYRPYKFAGSAASPKIYFGDKDLGLLGSGNYLFAEVTPGEHNVLVGKKKGEWVNWAPDTISQKVELQANTDYYFRMQIDNSGQGFFIIPMPYAPMVVTTGQSRIKFEMVEPEKAKEEITKTKYKNRN